MQLSSWNLVPNLSQNTPSKRWGHATCILHNQIIVFGGYAESQYFNDIWVFDTSTLIWKEVFASGEIPQPRSQATLNIHSNKKDLVLFGGGSTNKARFNSIHILNWQTKEWKLIKIDEAQILPDPRTYHTANIIDKYLVVFGGQDISDLNDLWLFNFETSKWNEIKFDKDQVKPSERRFHTSCQRGNQLIIMGGCKDKYVTLKDIYTMKFDDFLKQSNPQNLVWNQVKIDSSQKHLDRWGDTASYNQLNGKIYSFGGRNMLGDRNQLIEIDINQRKTALVDVTENQKPQGRRKHSAGFIGNSLVMFGGFNGRYLNSLHEILIPTKLLQKQEDPSLKNLADQIKLKYGCKNSRQIQNDPMNTDHSDTLGVLSVQSNRTSIQLEKNKYSHKNKILNQFEKESENTQQRFFKNTQIPDIIILTEQKFEQYRKQNIESQNICNPEMEEYDWQDLEFFYNLEQKKSSLKQEKITIEVEGICKLLVSPEIKTKNKYFETCIMQDHRIQIPKCLAPKDIKVLEACIICIESDVLVVSQKFTLADWTKMYEIADYLCAQSLVQKITRFFNQQVSLQFINDFIDISLCYKMKNLSKKCQQLIISDLYEKFAAQNIDIQEKDIVQNFSQFESSLWDEIFGGKKYPAQFCDLLMKHLEANLFSMTVRFANKVKQNKEDKQKKKGDNKQNVAAQNENQASLILQQI